MTENNSADRSSNAGANDVEVSKVTIKIPPFWTDRPEIWFYQIEAQFSINKIASEETKFNYMVSQLEPKYVENIWDIIKSTNVSKYSAAKERLLNIFKESEDKKIKRLITGIDLGDLKPSQLLRRMQSLAGADISNKVLRTLWFEKLPDYIKNVLLVSDEDLEKVAIMADKILEMNPRSELYCATKSPSQCSSKSGATMDDIVAKIAALEQQIAAIPLGNSQARTTHRSPRRGRSRSRSERKFNPDGKYCYYHFKFGSRCYPDKCKQPCSWKESENSKPQQN